MKKFLPLSLLVILFAVPSILFAQTATSTKVKKVIKPPLVMSAWIPYWKQTTGIEEIINNIKIFSQVNPFSFEGQPDGTIIDPLMIEDVEWQDALPVFRQKKVKIIPTVFWNDPIAIHTTLSSSTLRTEHISYIVALVNAYKFDGIDINYENKKAETNPYFSKFLKELSIKLKAKKKILSCTIEARTPISSRFTTPPKDLTYANDYKIINTYCDEVKIMAYDQRNVDIVLNKKKGKVTPYLPIADRDWVAKVIEETIKTISPKKIMLGVATYGYEYEISSSSLIVSSSTTNSSSSDNGKTYTRLRSLNFKDFSTLPIGFENAPRRNNAGELSVIYESENSSKIAWISDADAIAQKIALAKKYNLKGIAIFSIDGYGDPRMWSILK